MSVFITELLTLAVYCYFLLSLYKDREAIQMPKMLGSKYLKHYVTNGNHTIPYTMSGFRTELLTSAVY